MRSYRADVLGRALGLLGVAAAAVVVLIVSDVPYTIARALYTGLAANTNYGYVVDLLRHGRSWNFREGLDRPALVAA